MLLPSNGVWCICLSWSRCIATVLHTIIAASLGLFVSNCLQVYCHFFFFEGLCLWCPFLTSPSSPWLGLHNDCSPTSCAAPSLRPLASSSSLIQCQSIQIYHILFCLVQAKDWRVISASTSPVLKLYAVCSFISEGAGSYTVFRNWFFDSWQKTRPFASLSPAQGLPVDPARCPLLTQM
jgi:hypothetical protein